MSVKQQVLTILENNKGEFISGEEIANQLSVTRSAVWKAVKSLENEGYKISAGTNNGYCMSNENDILSANNISKYLNKKSEKYRIEIRKSVVSTNTALKELASKGEEAGKVIIAESQTGGKGRMGRSFFSPPGTGLYMSVLIKPDITAKDSLLITTCTAAAVARAIEAVTGLDAKIKWVNDIFFNDKKVCGILTEASMNFENGGIEYAVVGIGINITEPEEGYPDDLKNIITALFDNKSYFPEARSRLAAEILNNLSEYYENPCDEKYMKEYKERSFLIGRRVNITPVSGGIVSETAEVVDIDDRAGLVVRTDGGIIKTLTSGEVRILLR